MLRSVTDNHDVLVLMRHSLSIIGFRTFMALPMVAFCSMIEFAVNNGSRFHDCLFFPQVQRCHDSRLCSRFDVSNYCVSVEPRVFCDL